MLVRAVRSMIFDIMLYSASRRLAILSEMILKFFYLFALSEVFLRARLASRIHSFAGPYRMTIHRVYDCPPSESHQGVIHTVLHYTPKLHPRSIQRVSGNITITSPFNDSFTGGIGSDWWKDNKWSGESAAFTFAERLCSEMREHLPGLIRMLNPDFEKAKSCNVPVAIRTYDNLPVEFDAPKFPVGVYGKYRARFYGGVKPKVNLICLYIEAELVPKV